MLCTGDACEEDKCRDIQGEAPYMLEKSKRRRYDRLAQNGTVMSLEQLGSERPREQMDC
jgi:hypothetical protein